MVKFPRQLRQAGRRREQRIPNKSEEKKMKCGSCGNYATTEGYVRNLPSFGSIIL